MKSQRELFSLPRSNHYLNCAYMSPQLRSVEQAGISGIKRKSDPSSIGAADFFEPVETLRGLLGDLVSAPADRIAFIPSVSYGIGILANNLRLQRGDTVVILGEDFPSNVYSWMHACTSTGANLVTVERPEAETEQGRKWTHRLLETINDKTRVVALGNVHWTDGTVFDLESIAERTKEVDSFLVVDGTQSIGALPFDFNAIEPDLLVCAGYKWLMGPYQCGFAAVGDRLIESDPFEYNWINRRNSSNFSNLTDYELEYQTGARRFDVGERSNFIIVPMLTAAVQQLLNWGVSNIETYCRRLTDMVTDSLLGTPYRITEKASRPAHLFSIRPQSQDSVPQICAELEQRKVSVSVRAGGFRISPHVYNTDDDASALVEAFIKAS